MMFDLNKTHIRKLADLMSSEIPYLERLDRVAKSLGYANQAVLMARFNGKPDTAGSMKSPNRPKTTRNPESRINTGEHGSARPATIPEGTLAPHEKRKPLQEAELKTLPSGLRVPANSGRWIHLVDGYEKMLQDINDRDGIFIFAGEFGSQCVNLCGLTFEWAVRYSRHTHVSSSASAPFDPREHVIITHTSATEIDTIRRLVFHGGGEAAVSRLRAIAILQPATEIGPRMPRGKVQFF